MKKADAPEAADFALTLTPQGGALHLVPRIGVLGVGCRRGTTAQQLKEAFAAFCAASGLSPAAVCAAASIDLKKDEPGLAAFCKAHGWPITFYPADELRAVPGQFTPSAFVASVTGVDNVCERSAVKASGGTLLLPKTAGGGVTLALAVLTAATGMDALTHAVEAYVSVGAHPLTDASALEAIRLITLWLPKEKESIQPKLKDKTEKKDKGDKPNKEKKDGTAQGAPLSNEEDQHE